jgi:adenosylhomocysteine nucleosidase
VIGGSEKRVRGVGCLLGTIDGKPVALQKPVPGQGGSAGALGELVLGLRPENVLLAGTAGAVDPGLLPGDVVISDKALSPSGPTTARGLLLAVDPTLSEVAFRASMLGSAAPQPTTGAPKPAVRFRVGTVASREFWTAGRAMDPLTAARLGVIAVDNDTAAVARVCAKHRIPWLSGCGVSHRMGEQAGSEQARYRTLATENSSGFVLRVARTLVGRSRRPPAR